MVTLHLPCGDPLQGGGGLQVLHEHHLQNSGGHLLFVVCQPGICSLLPFCLFDLFIGSRPTGEESGKDPWWAWWACGITNSSTALLWNRQFFGSSLGPAPSQAAQTFVQLAQLSFSWTCMDWNNSVYHSNSQRHRIHMNESWQLDWSNLVLVFWCCSINVWLGLHICLYLIWSGRFGSVFPSFSIFSIHARWLRVQSEEAQVCSSKEEWLHTLPHHFWYSLSQSIHSSQGLTFTISIYQKRQMTTVCHLLIHTYNKIKVLMLNV